MSGQHYPSVKARKLLAILTREPLNYTVVRTQGSHKTLVAAEYPRLLFAFHDHKPSRRTPFARSWRKMWG